MLLHLGTSEALYDDKSKNLNFDNYFVNVIFSKTIAYNNYRVQILFGHSSDP